MKICIIDPAHHMPGLTRLFPEADYYAHSPDSFFNYHWTNHMPPSEFEKYYQFQYRTDWSSIRSENYNYVFIVFPLYDAYGKKPFQHDIALAMLERIYSIIRYQSFLHVSLFDVHDYPYDPSLYKDQPVTTFFKRNYSIKHSYSPNVHPFPLSMFLRPCVLWNMLDSIENMPIIDPSSKIMDAIWIGGTYTHTDHNEGIIRDREGIYRQIQPYIVSHHQLPYHDYLNSLKKYAIAIDLIGVGDPNKRTFEILASGTLLMTNITELDWGFDTGDSFSDLCIFSNGDDFLRKKIALLENKELYHDALINQNTIIRKYFNKDNLRNYITQKLPVYYSQSKEDIQLNRLFFKNKRNGIYLEMGAINGVLYSNTKFFEDHLQWTGILIEPHPKMFKELQQNRPHNKLYNELVSCINEPLTFNLYDSNHVAVCGVKTTLPKSDWFQFAVHSEQSIIITPKTLTDIIKSSGVTHIDFMSLDVEGHEYEVLQSWDFSIPIHLILIEMLGLQPEREMQCRDLLISHGYHFITTCSHNEVFVHCDSLSMFNIVVDKENTVSFNNI